MQKARLVLFDIGNVLLSINPAHVAFPLDGLGTEEASRVEEVVDAFRGSEVYMRFEHGRASVEEFCAAVRAEFRSSLSDEEIAHHYLRILGPEKEGMLLLVEDLKRLGVRVAALTNTDPIHLGAISQYPAVRALERVIASCVTGRKKPAPEAFQDALRRLDASPKETYFTDDLHANVEGARAAGIRADVFEGPDALREALEIK